MYLSLDGFVLDAFNTCLILCDILFPIVILYDLDYVLDGFGVLPVFDRLGCG